MRFVRCCGAMAAPHTVHDRAAKCQPKVIDLFKWKELPNNGQHPNLLLALPEIILFILQSFISDFARNKVLK